MTNTNLGLSKENPIEISNPSIYNEFTTQHRNRVWVKYNCSKCGKEVITQYIYWNYIKDPTKLNKFQCRECNCRDTKQPYYDNLNERDRQYEDSFEHTEDGYKIIHDIEEMKRLATNSERIVYHCENPDCTYHNQWFKMDLAKKARIGEYIKFGKLLCENCRFKLNYDTKHAAEERKKTFQEHWGTDHFMKNEEFKKDYFDNLEKKYGKGVKSTLTLPEVKAKTADTNLSKFGTIHPSQNSEIAKKISNTQLNFSTEKKERILNDRIDTNREKYGVDFYVETNDFKEAEKQGSIKKFGIENPFLDPVIRKELTKDGLESKHDKYGSYFVKPRKIYYYGLSFDSMWELAVFIYYKSLGCIIIREPTELLYEFAGKIHKYIPDFMINNQFVEVKGDHFFDDYGKMIPPARHSDWTDKKYEYMCGLYEAKHQCMIRNNVKILTLKDIEPILNIIESVHGPNYLKSFQLSDEILKDIKYTDYLKTIIMLYDNYSIPIHAVSKGITPYDLKEGDEYTKPGLLVTPFDLHK